MVTITDLTVKDQDFVFDGDIRLLGAISITNGNFIVNGHVLFTLKEAILLANP